MHVFTLFMLALVTTFHAGAQQSPAQTAAIDDVLAKALTALKDTTKLEGIDRIGLAALGNDPGEVTALLDLPPMVTP